MHTVGPSRMLADRAFVSSARCWPTLKSRSLSQVAASDMPHGNRAAYQLSAPMLWSIALYRIEEQQTFVPPTKILPRAPFGPSVVLAAGMPLAGMDFVRQKSAAVRSDTFVSGVSLLMFFLCLSKYRLRATLYLFFQRQGRQFLLGDLTGIIKPLSSAEWTPWGGRLRVRRRTWASATRRRSVGVDATVRVDIARKHSVCGSHYAE